MYSFLRPLLFTLPPETAHRLAIHALQLRAFFPADVISPKLATNVAGITFPSPIGMAPGFDKNAQAINGLLKIGFGFVEVGTVTPKPQAGNAKPRLFRLVEDEAVINRLGFNNAGADAFVKNIAAPRVPGVVGANIGKNKDQSDAIADYVTLYERLSPYADYVTVNISSPNTAGLRDLQQRDALSALLKALNVPRAQGRRVPLFLKIAPDLSAEEKAVIAELALTHALDALIVSNTTIRRDFALSNVHANEQGGLSGKPLMDFSTEALKDMYRLLQGKVPLIGVGGVASAEDAYAKIRAGAALVQLYTALVYQGFGLVHRINKGLITLLERDGFAAVQDAVGADLRRE